LGCLLPLTGIADETVVEEAGADGQEKPNDDIKRP